MLYISTTFIVLSVVIAIISYNCFVKRQTTDICWQDIISGTGITKCKPRCKSGEFGLAGMERCHPLLTCSDWHEVNIDSGNMIGQGLVKMVYKGKWRGKDIVINELSDHLYEEDFHHGFKMLKGFQHSPYVVQLVGRCNNAFVTEYHEGKSANNVPAILERIRTLRTNSETELSVRFDLCINYVEIIDFLHNSPLGVRVMCDTNDLRKTLDQFLVTDDLHLVVNDLDALPEVIHSNGTLIKCGKRELYGEFVAPEQTWPYEEKAFEDDVMIPYDEKTDIWKIPDVCNYFLHDLKHSRGIRLRLLGVHQSCKEILPHSRPSAAEVLRQFQDIRNAFFN